MDMNSSTPGNHEALLETLALRLSVRAFDPRTDKPQLFVGQLPDGLPVELPMLQGSRVIGSRARSAKHLDIVLDVPLPPEQALAFYKEQLLAAGWNEPEQAMHTPRHGGFVHSSLLARQHNALFCKGLHGPALNVIALLEQDGFTDVRLNLNLDERESPCGQSTRMARMQRLHGRAGEQLIPPLIPPANAHQRGGSGGGGDDSWYSTATLETDVDLGTLARHYSTQLEQAGWARTDEGTSGPAAWHIWTFQDEDNEPWYGMFFMLKTPGKEREYFLYIRVEWGNKPEQRGWFSFAPL